MNRGDEPAEVADANDANDVNDVRDVRDVRDVNDESDVRDVNDVNDLTDAPAAPALPDRANAPVSVVTERFLRAILTYVPLERIVELHLFSPLRQGGVETGIAVIAADIEVPDMRADVSPEEASLELSLERSEEVGDAVGDAAPGDAALGDAVLGDAAHDEGTAGTDIDIDAGLETGDSTVAEDMASRDAAQMATDGSHDVDADTASNDDDSPYLDDYPEPHVVAPAVVDDLQPEPEVHTPTQVRHTVYTARYRLVVKGPERGRWEIDVVNEADAPLLAVETVVRGVQRRAGEATDTVRYDATHIARALRTLPPAPTV